MQKKNIAVCLLSGGLDSCVISTLVKNKGYELYLLSVNYGQVMCKELINAKKIAGILEPKEHRILKMQDFNQISKSSRTDSNLIEYDYELEDERFEIPAAYPPGRDMSFILIASAWLESLMLDDIENVESGTIFIGTNKNDSIDFPDCKKEVYKLINQVFKISTKVSVQHQKEMKVKTPLIDLTKDKVVDLGIKINAPLHETWSCYEGKELACGRCDPCKLRLWSFKNAGFKDQIPYQEMPTFVSY